MYLKKVQLVVVICAVVDVTKRDHLFQISYSHKIINSSILYKFGGFNNIETMSMLYLSAMYKKYLCITNEYQEPKKLNNQQIKSYVVQLLKLCNSAKKKPISFFMKQQQQQQQQSVQHSNDSKNKSSLGSSLALENGAMS